jgi:hypothetical protein
VQNCGKLFTDVVEFANHAVSEINHHFFPLEINTLLIIFLQVAHKYEAATKG